MLNLSINSDVLSVKHFGGQKVIEVIHNFIIPSTADENEQLMNRNLKRTRWIHAEDYFD